MNSERCLGNLRLAHVLRNIFVMAIPEPSILPDYPHPTPDEQEEIKAAAQLQVQQHMSAGLQNVFWLKETLMVLEVDVENGYIIFRIDLKQRS